MKKICRLGTLLIVLTILFGIGGAFANNDDDFSDRFSYCRMPLTLKPEKTTVNAGDKIQVEYSVSRNTADGLTWCGDIRGYYEWVYINEYKNANGETVRWETTVNQEDERSIDSDSGTITLASIRSDFSQIELRMRVFATNNDNIYISSWDEAAHKSIIYYDEQIVSITISDAKPRENVTCDFTLASDKVEYGEEFTVQYKIRGLEDLDPEDIISTDHTVVQLTEAASEHGETGVLHNEGTLTGTVTGTAIDAYFFRVDVSVAWTDGGDTLYRDFKSPVIAVQRAYLGMTGWIEKDGKWYYGDENGYALVGRHLIGENSWTGLFYYFDKKGVLQTGWFPYKDSMGYADADGHMRIGLDFGNPIPHGTHLQQVDGDWYYFDGDGSIVTNMVVWDNDYKNRYYMDSSGKGIPLLNITEKEKVTGVYQVKEGKWKSSSVILNADGTAKLYFYNNDLDTYQKDTYQWIIRNGGVVLKDSSFGEYTEECAIRFDDIDRDQNTITVRRSVVRGPGKGFVYKDLPKNYSSYRTIIYPSEVVETIGLGFGYVITKSNPESITKQFSKALAAAGLPHFRLHDLRHYSASILHAIGIPDQYIMARGGWKTDNVMKRVYRDTLSDVDLEMQQKAVDYFAQMAK